MSEDKINDEFVHKIEKKIKKIKRQKKRIKILIVLIVLVIGCFISLTINGENTTKKLTSSDDEYIYDYPDINYSFTGISDNFGFKTGQINYSVQNGMLLVTDFYIKEDSDVDTDSIEEAEVKHIYSDGSSSSEYSREKNGDFVSWLNIVLGDTYVVSVCKDGTYTVEECTYIIDHVPYDFPGDFKIEITYCYSGNECTTEEFELSELSIMEEE